MLRIETQGSWYEMGAQLGRRFPAELRRCMDRFLAFLPAGAGTDRAVALARDIAMAHAPELLEEGRGIAHGAGLDEAELFRYRFYIDIRSFTKGCSAFVALDGDRRPWLGRTCDIEAEDHWCQLLHVRRPAGGCATVSQTYLGMAVAVGMNEHGFGLVGVSSPSREADTGEGLPASLLAHRALHRCRTAAEARALLAAGPACGKGRNMIAADAAGGSVLFEMAPGRTMLAVVRPRDRDWQTCTNFYASRQIPNADMPGYLYNALARYGRLVQCLGESPVSRDRPSLQRLLAEVSQPGPFIPRGASTLETAYATLFDLKGRRAYLAPGNPNAVGFEEVPF